MRYLYLVLCLFCGTSAFAQTSVSATFIIPDVEADNNTEVCLPITSTFFSSGVEFSFALQWTPPSEGGALDFSRVDISTSALPNLDPGDFNLIDYAAAGLITVEWGNYENGETCFERDGVVNLSAEDILFEVCFNVSGPVATNHPVNFFNLPDDPFTPEDESVDIVFNKSVQCGTFNDAFPGISNGSVTIGVKPLLLDIPEIEGIFQPDDIVCVDVVANSGFDQLKGFQFGIAFDTTVLRSVSATANTDLFQNSDSRYNLFGGTSFYGVWSPFPDLPQDLPDGATLVTACFEVVGECASRTDITVSEVTTIGESGVATLRPIDANGENTELASIPVVGSGFRFIVDNCNPEGFDVVVGCPEVEVNFGDTEVCVDFRAGDDFNGMTDIDYLILWDADVLEYDEIRNRNNAMNINLNNNGDFDFDRTDDGILGFEWSNGNTPVNLGEGEVNFSVCFNAVGFGGTSPIVITDYPNNSFIESTEESFSGLNPTNCAVTVQRPDGVAVTFTDEGFSSTADKCTDITVEGFTEVTGFTLYVSAANTTLAYQSFSSPIAGVTAVEISPGLLQINYPPGSPTISIADGGTLGTACYRAQDDAAPGDCVDFGLAAPDFIGSMVFTVESGANAIEPEAFNAEACVLFPNGFGLIVEDAEGDINDQLCVPVSVTRFNDVTEVATAFQFDPAALTYSSVTLNGNWPGLTMTNFSSTGTGQVNLNWSSPTPGGTAIADLDTVQVFELCFTTGPQLGCTEVEAVDGGMPAVTTTTGPGSIIYRTGEVCLNDRLEILSITVVDASCVGEDDGMVLYEIAPRPNNEDITVRAELPVRFSSDGSVGGLLPGMADLTFYNASGSVRLDTSVMIGVNPDNVAIADAGEDKQLSCGDSPLALIGGRFNTGVAFSVFIVNPDGVSTRFVDEGDVNGVAGNGSFVQRVTDPGTYIVEVTSAAGCTDRDTMIVMPASNPVANANDDGNVAVNCDPGGITLTCNGSSEGANVTRLWERVSTNLTVLDTVGTTCEVNVTEPGRYRLTITFVDLGCSETDLVIVSDENDLPNSILSRQEQLNCDGSPAVLSIGPAEDGIVYTWTELDSNLPLSVAPTFTTDQLGTYTVLLQDTLTGCTVLDTVEVIPSVGVPAITFPADQTINCNPDTTQLLVSFENTVEGSTRYLWSTDDGQIVVTDFGVANPRITMQGTYKVVASNGACRDSATVTIGAAVLPTVEAGNEGTLLCSEGFQLTGSAMSTTSTAFSFQWTLGGEPVPMGAAASVVVSAPGTYVLEAIDDLTGCVGIDSVVLLAPSGFPEYTLVDTVGGLGCDPTTVTLRVTGAGVVDYDIAWTDPLGASIGNESTVATGEPGTHFVSITNPTTGCTAIDSVVVVDDRVDVPFVSFRQNSLDISCESGRVIIDASGSSQGANLEYTWANVEGGEEPATQNNDSLRVGTAGTYRLTILNLATQCSTSRDVIITDSRVFPNVEAVEGMTLDCDVRTTTIGINIADQPNDYTIQWTAPPFVGELPQDTNRIEVTQGATYNAVIINPLTSCVTTIRFEVQDLIDSIATIAIMEPDSFDCNNTTITIDASDTDLNSTDPSGIVWSSFDGNNITPATGSLIVSVDGAGDYELAVTDATGCTVRDTVTVVAADDTPFAQAGDPQEIECGETLQLDGSASTPEPLPGILYEWTASNGGNIILDSENTARPFVDAAGTYTLIVSNLANGCADTSTTTVTLNAQTAANAGEDITSCDPTVMITGNLPAGTTGEWTAFNDDNSTWSADVEVVTVNDIGNGLSLVWTLSAGMECANYSADTVFVGPESAPVANNDVLTIGGGNNIGSVDLKTNDQFTGQATVTLLGEPAFGEILSNLNGDITFEAPMGFDGETTIEYEICSNVCENLCARATLNIFSDADGTEPTVFNAFTPNGDGMNEELIFTKLERNPDDFPDNELIIFNRWGDIIYEAKPYNNDWTGNNNSGAPVPEGTYYYILRLNVGEGDIIRGDVTVIR